MRRKRFQKGSLTTVKRNGRNHWLAQWREDGHHRTKELGLCSEVTRLRAESMLREILRPINAGVELRETRRFTFGQFVELVYLPVYQQKWKDSTRENETNQIQFHLVRGLSDRPMERIVRQEMQELLDTVGKTCGRSVLDHLRFRLRSIFIMAINEGVTDRNPAIDLFLPRHYQPGRERRVMDAEDLAKIAEILGDREYVIFRLATWEGMRPGEIVGLRLGDFEGDSVRVRRRIYRGKLGDPKTDRSARQVALTTVTKMLLEDWIRKLGITNVNDWLFPSESGRPIGRDNLWRRYMAPKLKPAGLDWATFQVMRRTFATRSKRAGVNAHTRSAQMGNSVDVNENEYAVASFEEKLAAVRLLETAVVQ